VQRRYTEQDDQRAEEDAEHGTYHLEVRFSKDSACIANATAKSQSIGTGAARQIVIAASAYSMRAFLRLGL